MTNAWESVTGALTGGDEEVEVVETSSLKQILGAVQVKRVKSLY